MVLNNQFTLEQALKVMKSGDEQPHVKKALEILEQCCENYNANEIFLSFNGGKDCTTVLHLAATMFKLKDISPLMCLYVTEDPFPEVDAFVDQAASYYGLKLIRKKKPIKSALETLQIENKTLKAGLMGTRRGDPGSEKLEFFSRTDPGWPKIMRVFPILDWSYGQVWQFLLEHKVPYCSLYDQGYTSLGSRATASPNPLLRNSEDSLSYAPAYTLLDDSTERQGRG